MYVVNTKALISCAVTAKLICPYVRSEHKGPDQLRGNSEADLPLCFCICKNRFSHDTAHFKTMNVKEMAENLQLI